MQLTGLVPLYRSMCAQHLERTKFRYRINDLNFDCLFFIDTQPFELVMGCLGHNFAIFRQVRQGFEINTFLDDATFFALRHALFRDAGSHNKLQTSTFFTEFNQHIPREASPAATPTPDDIGRYYPDLEHADKRFFCGWLDNSKQGNQVSAQNLAKTLRLMGRRAHDFAQRRNFSTRWTDDRRKAVALFVPE
jgi:hypothetical protein